MGKAEGRQDGRVEGQVTALLMILRARGVAVPAELEQLIRACGDGELRAKWSVRTATASTVTEFVGERDEVVSHP